MALLAYLAVAGPAARRDKLLSLFWPESDEAHARASLNQALYVLRRVLGQEAFTANGNGEISLNERAISCDVVAFEAALAEGDFEKALALYKGDLLDGFFIGGAPGFERWVDEERERLRQHAADAAWSLAEALASAGRTIEAERWARRAADLLPADEAVVRRLMVFLNRLGDRAAAISAYEAYVWRLAQEYELQASPETQLLAASIGQEHLEPATLALQPRRRAPRLRTVTRSVERIARRGWVVSLVAAAGAGFIAAIVLYPQPRQATDPLTRFPLSFAGQPAPAGGIGGTTIALSADGDHLVYVGKGPGGQELFLRPMDGLDAVPIPNTRGARAPFFSPDGEWLGFIAGNAIRKVRVAGGPAIPIATVTTNVPGASWGDNGAIVFATPSGLWQVPASGGEPSPLALSDTASGERFRWPHVLPGGGALVFTRIDSTGFHLAALSLATRTIVPLGLRGTSPRFIEPDHLVYGRADGVLLTVAFDPRTLRVKRGASPITQGVYVGIAGEMKLGVSRTGTLAYAPESQAGHLVIVDSAGRAERLEIGSHRFRSPRFSPDGKLVVTSILAPDGSQDLWIVDLARTTMRRVTFDSGSVAPVWSPDGRRVAYSSKPAGRRFGFAINRLAAHGTEAPDLLLPPAYNQFPGSFTPDSRTLVFERTSPVSGADIWILPLEGSRTPRPYLERPFNDRAPALSPDGRWLAFASDESGRYEVYVASFPRPGVPLQVSLEGGRLPRWVSDQELVYQSARGLVAVALHTASATLSAISHRSLVVGDGMAAEGEPYDVHPDGGRFVMIRESAAAGDVLVILNWFDVETTDGAARRRQ
jgi:serine/threonine-protein kinase